LYWTLMATLPPDPCAIGMGTSPPARKLASLPLSATRFGSARLWNRPLFERALTIAPMSYFWLKRNRFRKSLKVTFPSALVTSLPKSPFAFVQFKPSKVGAGNCSVVVRAILFLMPVGLVKSETPSSVIALRLTSAKARAAAPGCWPAFPAASAG
jgi:hypothetical protein